MALISIKSDSPAAAEAVELATGMAGLLMKFKNNRLAEAAVVELISAALDGKLSRELVGAVRARLETGFNPQRTAAPRA